MKKNKGFTLIEMLVVIAIIAVLVSIVVPVVSHSTTKAEAAVDAANLRSILGVLNSQMSFDRKEAPELVNELEVPDCKTFPDAKVHILFAHPGFIEVYFVFGGNYYGLPYFSDVATNGSSAITDFSKPTIGGDWYEVGVGKIE